MCANIYDAVYIIQEYNRNVSIAEKKVYEKYSPIDSLHDEIKEQFKKELNEAKASIEKPDQLNLRITEALLPDLVSKLVEWEKRSKSFFNNYKTRSTQDGTTYRIEVGFGESFGYKFVIRTPSPNTEDGKLISDMISIIDFLEEEEIDVKP